MKIKNIIALKDKLEQVTDSVEIHDKDNETMTVRYDVYEEFVFVSEGDKEIRLTPTEAKRLRTVLNNLL